MRQTEATSTNPKILRNRILVSDKELPFLLGMGKKSAREYAERCGAVVWIGNRKSYSVAKLEAGVR